MVTKRELSKWDRLALLGLFPLFAARLLVFFAIRRSPALHWRQRLALSFLQAQRATFPPHYLRWLIRRTTTSEAIVGYSVKQGIPHKSVTLDAATTAYGDIQGGIPAPTIHFLTPTSVKDDGGGTTLFYFHGGGFVNPLRGPAHMPFIMRCAAACGAKQAVVLEYCLAPEHPYPAQLVQCIAALRYLLDETGRRPDELVLAGDSAGGQLIGALLAHLVQPSPYAAPVKLDGKFRAALFVSPFVRLPPTTGDYDSYETNRKKDYIDRPQVDEFMGAFKGRNDEIWTNLCHGKGSDDVWKQVFARGPQGLVRKKMIIVGTAEILLDCCRVFAETHVRAETVVANRDTDCREFKGKDTVLVECEGEVHVQVALDSAVGYQKGTMERAIMSWLAGL
ncbi:Alpha/Beta hydrolase protein [Chaetomium fimeti]|uniref:Alpha/Beta hydrolase protein n=1 Tax=Chaetomium fimeti TaxID=1854472 RepID=A0AAE0HHY9_9PEZI|nr:Alpha/Beta hydrolase protein [Chaetomium fimeti]